MTVCFLGRVQKQVLSGLKSFSSPSKRLITSLMLSFVTSTSLVSGTQTLNLELNLTLPSYLERAA